MEFNTMDIDLIPSISYLCQCIIIIFDKNQYQTFLMAKKLVTYIRNNNNIDENDCNNIILVSTFNDINKNIFERIEIDENEINDLIYNINSLPNSLSGISGVLVETCKISVEYISVSNITKHNILKLKNMILKSYNSNINLSMPLLGLNNIDSNNEKNNKERNVKLPKLIITPLKNTEEAYNSFKIVLLGDSNVGKTAFFRRFFRNEFDGHFISTFGIDEASKNIKIFENIYKIQLWDTAGQERFRSIPQKYYDKADGIILMYDITSIETFDNIMSWISNIRKKANKNVIIYLIGNKCDLLNKRKISFDSGRKMAVDNKIKFIEISVKWDLNVSDVMYNLIYEVYEICGIKDENFINLNKRYTKNKTCCI